MIFNDITSKHHLLIWNESDDIPGGMRTAKKHQFNPPLAKMHRHFFLEGQGRPSQARNTLMPLKQTWKTAKLTVPIFLPISVPSPSTPVGGGFVLGPSASPQR